MTLVMHIDDDGVNLQTVKALNGTRIHIQQTVYFLKDKNVASENRTASSIIRT